MSLLIFFCGMNNTLIIKWLQLFKKRRQLLKPFLSFFWYNNLCIPFFHFWTFLKVFYEKQTKTNKAILCIMYARCFSGHFFEMWKSDLQKTYFDDFAQSATSDNAPLSKKSSKGCMPFRKLWFLHLSVKPSWSASINHIWKFWAVW